MTWEELVDSKVIRMQDHTLLGDPILFAISPPLCSVAQFCRDVFSAYPPFELFGLPRRLAPDAYQVQSVDLKAGGRFQFEIFPDFLRMYVYKTGKARVVTRFHENLQQYLGVPVELQDHQGNPLFSL